MIAETDIQFHTPDDVPHDWAETGYFNIYLPDKNIFMWMYIVHRAGVGVTVSDVEIIDRWSTSMSDAIYIDYTNHNPLPVDAARFALPSGLSFTAASLVDYRLQYDAAGVKLDVGFTAIMPPFDIHDPDMDPMAVGEDADSAASSGFGLAYASHFDMSVRAKGTLTIGGETHTIDCVATMDHSWGPRPESDFHPMTWTNAHFGEDYCLHAIFHFDRSGAPGAQHSFRHGYALVDGKVRGCKGGSVHVVRNGLYPTHVELRLTDVDDREHVVRGPMVNHHPWHLYGNCDSAMGMMQWWSDDAEGPGYGTYFDTWPLNRIRAS